MNPHHPGHPAAYPHHSSLSSSPHHTGPGGPHHGYGANGGGGGGGGSGSGGTTTTPDLPSPHSPPHGVSTDPATPYGSLQAGQGMGANGHHHGPGNMMTDHPHHPGHPHPHLPGHPAYPPVNHNNNCTLKQESGPSAPTSTQLCAGCGGQIVERWLLLAMDRYWHNGCLKCTYCSAALAEIGHSCYTRSGMILCKNDYRRIFGSGACAGCGNPIPPSEMVMRTGGSVFHLKCFTCSKCGGQLVSGDRYYLLSGSPVCETDWHKILKSSNVAAATAAAAAAGNGGAPVRKGKVGRPRRSRE